MNKPLFSIIVITFNQASIIAQSLDSTLVQNYSPLELLICDDSSTDDTAEVCQKWINRYGSLFEKSSYHKNRTNLGILQNIFQGISLSGGSLIKVLAGDDILAPGALNNAARFFSEHPDSYNVFGNVKGFRSDVNPMKIEFCEPRQTAKKFFSLTPGKQFGILASGNPVPAPGLFARRSFYQNISREDLSVKYLEDWTLWLKATSNGISLDYYDFDAVFYRLKNSGDHLPELKKIFLEDCLHIIDNIVIPNYSLLSPIEKTAALANKKKISMALERRPLLEKLFSFFLSLLRPLVRFNLYQRQAIENFQNFFPK